MSYAIGIDLGGMSAKAGVFDENGKLYLSKRCETDAGKGAKGTAHDLAELAKALIGESGAAVGAIGIGSPGVIDSARGTVVNWSNFGWKEVPLAQWVGEETGLPVYVANDANAAALGEAKYGSGKAFSDSVLITLGTGVGGGIVLEGKLFEGYRSAGGEIGHTVIKRGGRLCTCGRRGCLECYASATALKRAVREAIARHPDSLMQEEGEVSGKTAFRAARAGDPVARRIVREYVADLGEGIVNLVNLLRPQVIILGGGVSNEGDPLLVPLRAYVEKRIYAPKEYAPIEIVRAALGNDAGMYGAAAYAFSQRETAEHGGK